MLLLAHPSGNSFFRAAARSFHHAGWLRELHSCICWDQHLFLARYLPRRLTAQLARRSFDDVPLHLQHSYPWREVARLASAALPLAWLSRHEYGSFSLDAVYRSFDRHVARTLPSLSGLQAVYAYEDGARFTFEAARSLGLRRIYDLPIGYWRAARAIFEEEKDLQPEWASTLTGLNDSSAKLARKDDELQLADLVIVPSQYVHTTLSTYNATSAPIAVVPFGSPAPRVNLPAPRLTGPLRVLYVGSLGQRKGLSYALDAVESLGSQVSFTLIGKVTAPECVPLRTALERHQWVESLPHFQILEQMANHDVLVFPTLFDGFGLVITEALSQGLPVITTLNSGAPECIRDGVEGFIVPTRDSQSITQCLQKLATNREMLAVMRAACLRRSAELSWFRYEHSLRIAVGQMLAIPSVSQ